jgi:hypothetical protein
MLPDALPALMADGRARRANPGTTGRNFVLASVLLAVLVSLAAIDSRSLWIDETATWSVAQWPDLHQWWRALMANPNADAQEPAFQLYIYVWTSLFGDTEQAMRLSNLPWFAVGCAAIAKAALSPRLRLWWLLIVAAAPFNWYYLNEVRPYTMFFAGSALLCVAWIGLVKAAIEERRLSGGCIVMYAGGCVLVLSATVLGAVWIAASAIGIAICLRRRLDEFLSLVRTNWLVVAVCMGVSLIILAVASYSFLSGGRASTVGGFSLQSIGYGLLELEGAAGFGPGRNQLRLGLAGVPPGELLAMLAFGAAGLGLVLSAARRLDRTTALAAGVTCLIPLAFMVTMSLVLGWRVVGRHMTPLLLPISLAYAAETARLLRGGPWQRLAAAAFIAALLASTGMIRFSGRHMKDDYADAARYVRPFLAQSKTVLWAADPSGASYYHLVPIAALRHGASGASDLVFALPRQGGPDAGRRNPDVVVYSKPEIYDLTGTIKHYIAARDMKLVATFPAFAIYAAP